MEKKIAYCYARVSTQMQVDDGVSLDAQEKQLKYAAESQGYEVEMLREEGRSGKNITGRPVLTAALESLDKGEAEALFVTRLDRLARSTRDFLSIVDRSHKYGWRLALLDLGLDTATYQGRFVVTIMSAMAEMERGMISLRQKDVHQDRRDNKKVWGVDLGPLPLVEKSISERIFSERDLGLSYKAIAEKLNSEGIKTVLGGVKWYPSTVRHIYLRK
ncbi:MAG: recombinase family protein [Micrococcales bacterium]|jgi:DNA invertase Pin-like site-specific DNA recombinase|nr:recombinase family protein [Micrococcales bacterium]